MFSESDLNLIEDLAADLESRITRLAEAHHRSEDRSSRLVSIDLAMEWNRTDRIVSTLRRLVDLGRNFPGLVEERACDLATEIAKAS